MKTSLEVHVEHPIMYLADPDAACEVPIEIGEMPIAANPECVVFRVCPYMDGRAKVTISSEAPVSEVGANFNTSIKCESAVLALCDSTTFTYCLFPIEGTVAEADIWIFDDESVWVWLRPLVEY